MTNLQIIDSLDSFYQPHCSFTLSVITGLTWGVASMPDYVESDDEPPMILPPDAEIPIDGYLGRYEVQKRRIEIFMKAVTATAERLNCKPEVLLSVVRVHEYAHAILHLGLDGTGRQCDTAVYLSIEEVVHETVAQILTARVIKARVADTTDEQAKAAWRHIQSVVFPDLEGRQSALYKQWHQFESISAPRLRSLLQEVRRATSLNRWDGFSLMGN
jgi:hypothetical protein